MSKDTNIEQYPGKEYQRLFNYLKSEYNFIAFQSEMDEIIQIVREGFCKPSADVQKAAEEYAKGEYPIRTEEEYYKDDVDEPYYDYSSTAFIIQKRIQMAFLAGTQWKGEEVEALKKEIERLKCFLEALVRERAYERMVIENKHNTAFAIQERTDEEWEQFKSENNL